MSTTKAELRAMLRRTRATLASPYRADATTRVNSRLIGHRRVQAGPVIGAYAATASELNIDVTLEALIRMHGRVLLPRVLADTVEFAPCVAVDELAVGFAGVREPIHEAHPIDRLDVLLVPGVGFDRCGRRIGNGAGHYDRILAQLPPTCVTIGVAFEQQLVGAIPTEPHDLPVMYVATEAALYVANGPDNAP